MRTKNGDKQKHSSVTGDRMRSRPPFVSQSTWTILRAALNHAFNDGKVAFDHAWRRVKPFKKVDAARCVICPLPKQKIDQRI